MTERNISNVIDGISSIENTDDNQAKETSKQISRDISINVFYFLVGYILPSSIFRIFKLLGVISFPIFLIEFVFTVHSEPFRPIRIYDLMTYNKLHHYNNMFITIPSSKDASTPKSICSSYRKIRLQSSNNEDHA